MAHRAPLLHCSGVPGFQGSRVPLLATSLLCTPWAEGPMGRQLVESRGHRAVQWMSVYRATQAANYHLRLLTHFPLAQLTHKSGLLRQHQFLFLVLLLSSTKPRQSSLWPLLTHEGHLPLYPNPTLGLRSKRTLGVIQVGLSGFLFAKCSLNLSSQTHTATNVKKGVLALLYSILSPYLWNMVFLRASISLHLAHPLPFHPSAAA